MKPRTLNPTLNLNPKPYTPYNTLNPKTQSPNRTPFRGLGGEVSVASILKTPELALIEDHVVDIPFPKGPYTLLLWN